MSDQPAGQVHTDREAIYRDNILDHYRHPRNSGVIERPHVHRRETNFSCGDQIDLYLAFDDAGQVSEAKFTGQGCAISLAAVSMLTEELVGKTREELAALREEDIFRLLGVEVGEARRRCALLGLEALRRGLQETEG